MIDVYRVLKELKNNGINSIDGYELKKMLNEKNINICDDDLDKTLDLMELNGYIRGTYVSDKEM